MSNLTARLEADNARLRAALIQFIVAGDAHIASNGEAVVGRDGRQPQTIGMMKASYLIVDALKVAREAVAESVNLVGELAPGEMQTLMKV